MPPRPIFVAATRQHMGKTTVSLAIMAELQVCSPPSEPLVLACVCLPPDLRRGFVVCFHSGASTRSVS
jgi:hypothetical protein